MSEDSVEVGPEQRDAESAGTDDALLSRLRVIEDQPLDQRAEAYAAVHDELRVQLEGADPSTHRQGQGDTGSGHRQAKN